LESEESASLIEGGLRLHRAEELLSSFANLAFEMLKQTPWCISRGTTTLRYARLMRIDGFGLVGSLSDNLARQRRISASERAERRESKRTLPRPEIRHYEHVSMSISTEIEVGNGRLSGDC